MIWDYHVVKGGEHPGPKESCSRYSCALARPSEQLTAMRGVKLCAWCQDRHFRPYPEQAASSCNYVECQCWCSQGTGQ